MCLSLWKSVALELLHQFKELHTADVIRDTPQRSLGWVRHDSRRLRVNELVLIAQARFSDARLILLRVDLLDGGAHNPIVPRDHGVFES